MRLIVMFLLIFAPTSCALAQGNWTGKEFLDACKVLATSVDAKKVKDLSAMSIDELWALHETVAATLVAKMTAEKRVIEDRLRLLDQARSDANENNRAG